MVLKTEHFSDVLVVALPTDVDAANATSVREELIGRTTHAVSCLVVDLSDTRYLDSAGLDMLFRLRTRMRQRRKALRLAVPEHSPLRRLLEIVSVEAAGIPVYARVEEAIQAAAATPLEHHANSSGLCRTRALGPPLAGAAGLFALMIDDEMPDGNL